MFLSWIWFSISKYDKDCFIKSCKRIKVSKSCCYIWLLAVMLTVQRSFRCSQILLRRSMIVDWPLLSKKERVFICKEGWCVEPGQEGDCLREGGVNCEIP